MTHSRPGEDIASFAKRLVAMANASHKAAVGTYHGTRLVAWPGSAEAEVAHPWHSARAERYFG